MAARAWMTIGTGILRGWPFHSRPKWEALRDLVARILRGEVGGRFGASVLRS